VGPHKDQNAVCAKKHDRQGNFIVAGQVNDFPGFVFRIALESIELRGRRFEGGSLENLPRPKGTSADQTVTSTSFHSFGILGIHTIVNVSDGIKPRSTFYLPGKRILENVV
jgi:hypothetical protein